jgi:NADH-quinone oxidoreductase subunit I
MRCIIRKLTELWSLVVGLFITGKYFVSPHVTVHYPRAVVEPENTATFRGPIELVGLPKKPDTPKCISCMLCVTACPSKCISIKKSPAPTLSAAEEKALAEAEARGETVKRPSAPRNPALWQYDFTLCSLCGCCVEACPVGSIRFSNELYLSGLSRGDFHWDLLARLKRLARKNNPAAAPVPAAPSGGDTQTPAREA